jgi:hypothetical protein
LAVKTREARETRERVSPLSIMIMRREGEFPSLTAGEFLYSKVSNESAISQTI